ncbi:hypothetical protein Syun_023737 [Stephania yunnanensis]|uniref:Uncharacterized protein n=1 Tax=Stephania yunnanensis TaxID=152371 RepID=A0AAP0FAA3_9MAGN
MPSMMDCSQLIPRISPKSRVKIPVVRRRGGGRGGVIGRGGIIGRGETVTIVGDHDPALLKYFDCTRLFQHSMFDGNVVYQFEIMEYKIYLIAENIFEEEDEPVGGRYAVRPMCEIEAPRATEALRKRHRARKRMNQYPELPQTLLVHPLRPPPCPSRFPQPNVALPLTTANPFSLTFNYCIIDSAAALSLHYRKTSVTLSHKLSITTSSNPQIGKEKKEKKEKGKGAPRRHSRTPELISPTPTAPKMDIRSTLKRQGERSSGSSKVERAPAAAETAKVRPRKMRHRRCCGSEELLVWTSAEQNSSRSGRQAGQISHTGLANPVVSSRLDKGGKGVLIVKFDMLMDSELGDLKGKLEVFVEERLEVRLCGSTVKMLFDPLISYPINLLQVWKVEETGSEIHEGLSRAVPSWWEIGAITVVSGHKVRVVCRIHSSEYESESRVVRPRSGRGGAPGAELAETGRMAVGTTTRLCG